MGKTSEIGGHHRHASQRSYAFHNNLHANAQSKSGPVLAILGAEPRTARAPRQHEGEGVVAQLDPKQPPQHYFAAVTQRYLTLTPLAQSKTIGSKYARSQPPARVKVKSKPQPEPKRTLEPGSTWRPGRRGTIATPGTAAVVDERVESALEANSDEGSVEGEYLEGWVSDAVTRIDLDEVRSVQAIPFALRTAALAEDEESKKAGKNALDNFEFADADLEAHAIHVVVDVEGKRPFVILTYAEGSDFAHELVGAHRTALRRNVLKLTPSKVADPRAFATAASLLTTRRDATEADLEHAQRVIEQLETALCDDDDDDGCYDDDAERTHDFKRKQERDRQLKSYGERMARDPSLPLPVLAVVPHTGRLERVRKLDSDSTYRDAKLLRDVEADLAIDIALKRAFFTSGRLAARIFGWVERLSRDLEERAQLEGAYRTIHAADEDAARRSIRKAQAGLVMRCVAGLKALRAALHDARGVKERFATMRFRHWSPSRIVEALSADHYNHTDHLDDKLQLERQRNERTERRKENDGLLTPDERQTARKALQKARRTFIEKHLTQHAADVPQTPGAQPHEAVAAFSRALSKPAPARTIVSFRSIEAEKLPGETFADAAHRLSRGCAATQNRRAILTAVKAASSRKPNVAADIASAARSLLASPTVHDDDSSIASTSTQSSLFRAAAQMSSKSAPSSPASSIASSRSAAESWLQPDWPQAGSSTSSVSVLQRPPHVFVKDAAAAVAYGDVPTLRGDALLASDDALHFTRLLDAQVDVLVALDDVCDARKREGDAQVWITALGDDETAVPRPMEGRWVTMRLARGNETLDGPRAMLAALFERCVALGLRLGKAPDLDVTARHFPPQLESAVAVYGGDGASALALLNHSTLLVALLQASHEARTCAHHHCADELDDFLVKPEFYAPLRANRVTRLAATNLREVVRLVRAVDDSAAAAQEKQLS